MKIERDDTETRFQRDFSDAPGLMEPHVMGRVERAATREELYHVVYYRRVLVPHEFSSREEAMEWALGTLLLVDDAAARLTEEDQ